jgi:type IV pilus assembly protein PilA
MKRFRKHEGFTLIELLIVIIIIGILAAIAIPMFLGQRDKAKEASVKEGIHSIQIGVQSYAVDYNDFYPTTVTQAAMVDYVDIWPKNAWTQAVMAPSAGKGNFSYTGGGASVFQLIGFGKAGTGIITVP